MLQYFVLIATLIAFIDVYGVHSDSNGFCNYEETPVTETINRTRTVEQCCDGYLRKKDKCLPQCRIECQNSTCTRPDSCTCNPGYKPTADRHRCESICSDGYELNKDTNECDSVCDTPCTNGICTGRNVCECNSGYHHDQNEGTCVKNDCDPATTDRNECSNGKCTSNGICQCNEGFSKDYQQTTKASKIICKPICSGGLEFNRELNECKKNSSYCAVCQCVKKLFVQPLKVPKLCYLVVMLVVLCIVIVCAFSVCLYRKYVKKIKHQFITKVVYRKELNTDSASYLVV